MASSQRQRMTTRHCRPRSTERRRMLASTKPGRRVSCGRRETLLSKEEVQEKKAIFMNKGWYVFEASSPEVEELKTNPAKREELFLTLMRRTLDEMLSEIDETNFPPRVKLIVCPG